MPVPPARSPVAGTSCPSPSRGHPVPSTPLPPFAFPRSPRLMASPPSMLTKRTPWKSSASRSATRWRAISRVEWRLDRTQFRHRPSRNHPAGRSLRPDTSCKREIRIIRMIQKGMSSSSTSSGVMILGGSFFPPTLAMRTEIRVWVPFFSRFTSKRSMASKRSTSFLKP